MDSLQDLEKILEYAVGQERIKPLLDLSFMLRVRDKSKMRSFIDEALELSLEHSDRSGESRSYQILSVYWGITGDYEKSLENALKSLFISREIGETSTLARSYNNLSIIYSRLHDNDNYLKYVKLTLDAAEKAGNELVRSTALNNLAVYYQDKEDYEKSLKYYLESLSIREDLGNLDELALSLINCGSIYLKMGDSEKTLEYINRAMQISLDEGNRFVEAAASSVLAEIEFAGGNLQKAIEYLDKSLNIAVEMDDPDLQLRILQDFTVFYEDAERYEEALEYYRQYSRLKDEIFTEKKNQHLAQIRADFELQEKEREAEIYRLRNLELLASKEAAESADKAKGDFLAMMSHEIRTPMSIILGMLKFFMETDLTPEQMDYLTKAHIASESLLGILNDILDFSRIEAGKIEFESIPFKPAVVLREAVSVFEMDMIDKGLQLRIEHDEKIPQILLGDPLRIGQVLRNLISNAAKFTSKGSITMTSSIISQDESSIEIEFSVRDTGIGIKPEVYDSLFEPFRQAEGYITRQFGGTGLGLAICRRLVDGMGGGIRVESTTDMGSTFFFRIPFLVPDQKLLEIMSPTEGVLPDLSGNLVLFVEDIDAIREITGRFLDRLNVEHIEAVNGSEALKKIEENNFDLILMDIQMPVMDGLKATKKLRERGVAIPIIAMTGHAMDDQRAMCLEASMNDFLFKPFSMRELHVMLVKWLRPEQCTEFHTQDQ
ncbi:MAG: tetratricopeptide repeat protein [Candidatus Aegiribacteria sp.]|nr:tetratricopeptide repeat protein [Candidatus Aegiribacteria sp.]